MAAQWVASWRITLRELQQLAAGRVPARLRKQAREDVRAFTMPSEDELPRFLARVHKQAQERAQHASRSQSSRSHRTAGRKDQRANRPRG